MAAPRRHRSRRAAGAAERARARRRRLSRQAIISRDGHRHEPLARVFPLGSRLNERGVLEIGGCDTIELAREFGTPAYVVAEDDLRARARAFVGRGRDAGHEDFHVVFASKAFPCTAVLRAVRQEGLWCDVASGGELHLALRAGFAPERIVLHGNAKSEAELRMALRHRVGADRDRQLRRDRAPRRADRRRRGRRPGGGQPVLVRVTPDVRGETHEKISTGQADSKFGFSMAEAREAIERVRAVARAVAARACTRTSARSCSSSSRSAAPARASWRALGEFPVLRPRRRPRRALHRGASPRRPRSRSTSARSSAPRTSRHRPAARLLIEPGRALTRQRRRHALHGRERQAERLALGRRRRRHVGQPAPDALRRAPTKRTSPTASAAPPSACWPASTASPAT